MITYAYWTLIVALMLGTLWLLGIRQQSWRSGLAAAIAVLGLGSGAYFFHYQQIFVKNWGGVMTIKTPPGYYHIGTTWKDDNLWVETFNPSDNSCHFNEYSRGDLLQGEVVVRNCNPVLPQTTQSSAP